MPNIVEPEFEIDEKGRVLCKSHSNYEFFKKPTFTRDQEISLEKQLTCETCSHYLKDDCYFPRSQINLIEDDRKNRNAFKCKLCGNKIDRMLTVIHKLYYKEKYNIEIPLVCCVCYDSLKKNKFIEMSKKRINLAFIPFIANIFIWAVIIIYSYMFSAIPLSLLLLIIFILFNYELYRYIKKRKGIEKGMKYYNKNFIDSKDDDL